MWDYHLRPVTGDGMHGIAELVPLPHFSRWSKKHSDMNGVRSGVFGPGSSYRTPLGASAADKQLCLEQKEFVGKTNLQFSILLFDSKAKAQFLY